MTAPASLAVPAAYGRHSRRRNAGQPDPKLVLVLASGAIFVSILDLTVVNVAFPDLRADFPSASLPTLSWVVTAYAVMFAALLSTAGRLADVVGRQRLFVWSVAAFTVTSVFAAVATNESSLIYFRALQGAAAAGMSPAALGLILTWTPRERLMPAIGIWGATGSVAAAVGPALGGVLVDTWGWRVIFLINVPLGLAVIYGAVTRLIRDSPGGRRLPDPVGTVFLTVGIGAVVVSLSQGSDWGWASGRVLLGLAGGVLGVGASMVRSAHHPVPALELDLWRSRTFTVANIATVLFSASAFALVFSGPLFLTSTWKYSVFETGLALTPSAFASGVGSVVAGKRATTPASQRTAAVGGSLLVASAGFFLWACLGTEKRFFEVYLPASLMFGVGFGFALTALFGAGAASIPPTRFASGSGVLTMSRQLGGAFGIAAAAAILAAAGYSAAVDPFLAVYLFCGVIAMVAAVASFRLPQPSPAAAVEAAEVGGTADTVETVETVEADGTGGAVEAGGAVEGAGAGGAAGAVPGTSDVGAWLFGFRFRGELDWVELLPVGPLGVRADPVTQRHLIQSRLGQVGAIHDGRGHGHSHSDGRGLYDSVLAAFRRMNSAYQSDLSNTVVVFTDVRDDDPAGITLENLLTTLDNEFDPARPVQVNIISCGDTVDRGALARIAEATRGGVYAASSPQQVRELFLTAMSPRAGAH